ncbi:MAG: 2-oxo acid dehydrogenase subunit E2 [Proteobacteria bacterium]|nr:2-oxo acid dehydrogenase subunit E2 [Pseudomonadota bacterium]
MTTEVILPGLGESISEGTIVRWLKQPGDAVKRDEDLVLVSTDKIETEVPAPMAGVLVAHQVAEGATVEVGDVIALLDAGDGAAAADDESTEIATAPGAQRPERAPAAVSAPVTDPGHGAAAVLAVPDGYKLFVSPVVRRLARENNVDLGQVSGTGRGGRVTRKDLEAFVGTGYVRPAEGYVPGQRVDAFRGRVPFAADTPGKYAPQIYAGDEVVPLSPLGKAMAEHMAWTWWRAPHVSTVIEVDMSRIAATRGKRSYTLVVAHHVAQALWDHKGFNSSLDGDRKIVHKRINLGVAVAKKNGGLVVPVLHGAGERSLDELDTDFKAVVGRARDNKIQASDLRGGTFTITNVGSNGNLASMPLINQPQVAILAIGAIVKRVVVVTDENGHDAMAIRPMMYVTLTYDHRANDGAASGRFLKDLRKRLEQG